MRWIRPLAEPWFSVDIESGSIAVDEVQLVTVEVPWARRYEMRSHAVEENFGTVALQVRAWGLEGWTVGAGKSEPKVKLPPKSDATFAICTKTALFGSLKF